MAKDEVQSGPRTIALSVMLFLLVLAVATFTTTIGYGMHPAIFLLFAVVGSAALVAATLELLGRPAHVLGSLSAAGGSLVGIGLLLPAPTMSAPEVLAMISWGPVLILWSTLAATRLLPIRFRFRELRPR